MVFTVFTLKLIRDMKTIQLIFCVLFFTSFSCKKEDGPYGPWRPEPPEPGPMPTLVWKAFLHESRTECSSLPPVIFENTVLFGAERYGHTGNMEIFALPKTGGERLWTWQEWKNHSASPFSPNMYRVSEPYIMLGYPREVHKVDMRNGQTIWSDYRPDESSGDYRFGSFGDMFFAEHVISGQDYSALVRCSISQFQGWDTIYAAHKGADNFSPSFCSPACTVAPWGDTLVIFQNRGVNFSNYAAGHISVLAYNLTADTLLWQTPLTEQNSNVALPLIEEDRIYFQSEEAVYCFDLTTGNIRWRQDFGGNQGFMTTNLLLIGEKLIAGPNGTDLFAVNKMTGQLIWRNSNSGGSRHYMVHYKGRIYFTAMGSAKLHCVDATTGVQIFAERPPTATEDDRATYFESEIAIDEATGLLYTHDRFHALCLKLPE